jgi:KaiC/GvpD/RAD55 family RecA-like ATPase
MMNEATIRQWFDIFRDNHELVEIRIIDPAVKRTYSGYFTDVETILREVKKYNNCNVYFTLNVIDDACYSREQHDRIVTKPKSTTSDNEIIARKWCLIDIDCEKPSDTNSSDEEKELAKQVVNNVFKFLRDEGFERPIVCDSANGFHLLLKQAMKSTPENTETMKKFLQVLDMYFSTDKVKIDCSTFNPSRICKLYGTYSRKGADTADRPQRCSSILRVPNEVKVTPNEYFEKVASYLPEPVKKDKYNNYGASTFDLDAFLSEHNIRVSKVTETAMYTKYVLEECPFDSSHRAPDSAVFKMRDGSFGFKCLHNSCSHYTFKDFRLRFDPKAYDRKDFSEFQFKQRQYGKVREVYEPIKETEEKGKKWLSMKDIKRVDISELLSIPTGYTELDKKIIGLFAGELTVLSGLNASGKTSWLDCLALNVVQKGFKVAIWSGEMQDWRFQGWINQIAAGKTCVRKKEGYENFYYTPTQYCEKIEAWLDNKLYLYNNSYGSKWEQLFADVKEVVENEGVHLVVLDNLAALNIDGYDGEKYSKQTKFILDLKDYAKQKNIHVILVCHPRKENYFLRKESISGTADLTNIADNLFLIHRVGNDFEKRAGEFFGVDKVQPYLEFSNVIEVAKNRQMGVVDYLVGMYFEPESRRLKNTVAEHLVFDWQKEPSQMSFSEDNPMASNYAPPPTEFDYCDFDSNDDYSFDPFGDNDSSPF